MSKISEIWDKLKSKGDAVIAAFLAAVVLRRFEGNDNQAAEEVGKAAAAFTERFFEGEHDLEAIAVLKKVLSEESWERAVAYFREYPGDHFEQAIGKMWRAVRENGVTYNSLNQDGNMVAQNVGDPVEMFQELFEGIFKEGRPNEEIHAQLELLYQASAWHRFTRWASPLVSPRTLRNICIGVGATVSLVVIGVVWLFATMLPLFLSAIYGLIISPLGGVGDLVAGALFWGFLLLVASPAPLLALRFFGIRPARKTYLRFARNAFLIGVGLRIFTGVPELIRAGSSQAHEIAVAGNTIGAIVSEDGTPLRCRPIGDLDEEDWFPFVYVCNGNEPGFTPKTSEPGRGLTPAEARRYLKWQEDQKAEEADRKTETKKSASIAKPIEDLKDPLLKGGMQAMMDKESFMERIYDMGYTTDQIGSIIVLAPESGWSDPVDVIKEMEEYFEENGGLKPDHKYFTYPISKGDLRVKNHGTEVEIPSADETDQYLPWGAAPEFEIKAGRSEEWLIVFANGLPRRK